MVLVNAQPLGSALDQPRPASRSVTIEEGDRTNDIDASHIEVTIRDSITKIPGLPGDEMPNGMLIAGVPQRQEK
jgi:hypothetical protein